ncbi:MAG: MFS transporter [Pseudomonadota bacterium]
MAGERLTLAGQAAPIVTISVLAISLSMSMPLFTLLLEREGYSGTVIGLASMAAPFAMVVLAPLMPIVMRRIGLATLFAGSTLTAAASFVAIPMVDGLIAWSLLRGLWGAATAGMFFTAEFWIVAAAPATLRGRVIALYGVVVTAAFAAGPAVILLTGDRGALPFLTAAAICLVALAPLAYGARAAPDPSPDSLAPRPTSALRYLRSDPTLILAVTLFGVIEYGGLSLFPAWALRAGFGVESGVTLLSVFALGAMILSLPLGWAADRVATRRLLVLAAMACVIAPAAMAMTAPAFGAAAAAMLVWGGFGAGLYTLALVGLGNRYEGQALAEATASITLAYGVGALMAPAAMGLAMDSVLPPHGLMLGAALVAVLYAAFVIARLTTHRREDAKGGDA